MKVTYTIGSGLCMKCHMATTTPHTIDECVSALDKMRTAFMNTLAYVHAGCGEECGCGAREALESRPVMSEGTDMEEATDLDRAQQAAAYWEASSKWWRHRYETGAAPHSSTECETHRNCYIGV